MASPLARLRGVPRDTQLFLLYTLAANIAIGVFQLDFNLYLVELDFQEDFIGLANALQTLAMAVTAFFLGRLLSGYGVWRLVTLSQVAFVATSSLLALSTSAETILPVVILWGGAASFLFSAVMPFVVELSDVDRRQRVAALTVSTSMVAMTVGSLLGGWVPRGVAMVMDVERASVTAFRGALVAGIIVAALGIVPLLLMSQERRRPAPDDAAGMDEVPVRPGLPPLPGPAIRQRMLVFIAVGGLMSLGAGVVFPFFNVYLASIGAAPGEIGLIFAGASIFAAVTTLAAPRFVELVGDERAITLGRLSPVPFFILLIATPNLALATVAHLIRTASQGMGWSVESTMMSTALPRRALQSIFGYRSGTWNIGYSLASLAGGALIVRWGYAPTFAIYAGFMLAAMMLFYVYFAYISPIEGRDAEPGPEPVPGAAEQPVLRGRSRT